MAQLIVRNLEDAVKTKLQRRAKRHRRSMEEEVRDILRAIPDEEESPAGGLGSAIAGLFSNVGLVSNITELRGRQVKPASFKP